MYYILIVELNTFMLLACLYDSSGQHAVGVCALFITAGENGNIVSQLNPFDDSACSMETSCDS